MRARGLVLGAVLLAIAVPVRGQAQDARRDLRDSQMRLDSIRQERARLERETEQLRTRVRDASREVSLVTRQRAASAAALEELDLQAKLLNEQTEQTRLELDATQKQLGERALSLRSRLRSIYKRGPLHSVNVLLGAENFSDLLSRYKYLHLVTSHDRRVLDDVRRLQSQLSQQEEQLAQTFTQLESLRDQKSSELAQLRRIESQSQRALTEVRRAETQTVERLGETTRMEKQLADLITRLERERREEESRRRGASGAVVEGALSTRELGTLNWPVDGQVIYRFGPTRRPSGVTLINKGIGIAAPAGTPVKAVEEGAVSLARQLEGYGLTVMLDHGGGFYTLYMFLRSASVREGTRVVNGQVVGLVGGEQTPEGPHLYFQVRAPVQGDVPEAVDPVAWLRARAGLR